MAATEQLKLGIYSDVHLECGKLRLPDTEADVLIFAGDIGPGLSGAAWILKESRGKPSLYVAGNHEAYSRKYSLEDLDDALDRKCVGTNIFFCRQPGRRVDIADVRFLATTLWTDYAVFGDPDFAMKRAIEQMNDYSNIRVNRYLWEPGGDRFTPAIALSRHQAAVSWLVDELRRPWSGKTVLVTHHAPTPRSLDELDHDGDEACYASNLEWLFTTGSGIDLVVHGHIHRRLDYRVGRTRVVANPRGYADVYRDVKEFDRSLVIEV